MNKLNAWLMSLIGLLLILAALGLFSVTENWFLWVAGLAVLIMGLSKMVWNTNRKR
jgi:glucose dehydrogenase